MLNRTLIRHFVRTALSWLGTALIIALLLLFLMTLTAYLASEAGP